MMYDLPDVDRLVVAQQHHHSTRLKIVILRVSRQGASPRYFPNLPPLDAKGSFKVSSYNHRGYDIVSAIIRST
jgi:hypothetical protein